MSAWWRATWFSSRIPLPPRMSRASATIARALAAWFILASEAMPAVRRSSPASSRQPQAQQLHGGDLGHHAAELVLHELEGGERLAELLALLGVGQRRLVGGERHAERAPGDRVAGAGRARGRRRGTSGSPAAGSRPGTRTPSSVISACHTARSAVLPVMTVGVEARRALLDEVAADVAVLAARPDDHDVGDRGVADPASCAPSSTNSSPSRRALVSSATASEPCSGSVSPNAPIASSAAIARQPALASAPRSRAGAIDCIARFECTPKKVPDAAVGARPLHAHEAGGGGAHARAAVALDRRRRPVRARRSSGRARTGTPRAPSSR